MVINFTPSIFIKTIFVFVGFLFATSGQLSAQTVYTNKANLKAETKRSRKEAARIETEYKETHLNTVDLTYKKGEASHKRAKAQTKWDTYQDEKYDEVLYTAPVKPKANRKVSLKKISGLISI